MAGDWIKMNANLGTNPKVIMMADALETSEHHIVGLLFHVWCWADQHSLEGNALSVTEAFLDRLTSVTGFSQSLRNVGWLGGEDGNLHFPNFQEHNGQTAKKRAQTAKRVAKHKTNAPSVTNALPREEKRREDIKREREPARAEQILNLWPKRSGGRDALPMILQDLETHDPDEIECNTRAIAIRVKSAGKLTNKFTPNAKTFFTNRDWLDGADAFMSRYQTETTNQKPTIDPHDASGWERKPE